MEKINKIIITNNLINNSKTLINNGTLNITINITNPDDLDKLDILNIVK